jgi:hypothetical protein
MNSLTSVGVALLTCAVAVFAVLALGEGGDHRWEISEPLLVPGPEGSFDEIAVKDPSIVFFEGSWHLFYTARSKTEYTTGYISSTELSGLQSAQRHELDMIRGKSRYGCAPQILYFEPQRKWYLIFQTRDSNYQPMFSTTTTIAKPESWSKPSRLVRKDTGAKWIDFWVISDKKKVYLFYTQSHNEVITRSTNLEKFPGGWTEGRKILDGAHEAVHVYKVKDQKEFHMIYELNDGEMRSFGLAIAKDLAGPWRKTTDNYAAGNKLSTFGEASTWTEMVSHGEVLRSSYNEEMEYNPDGCRWIIQGIRRENARDSYPSLPWKLGIMKEIESDKEQKPPEGAQ